MPGTMPESRDPDYLSFYAPCLPGSPLLPKQALSSHSTIEAPNAYINIPIDFPLASHYQDLFIPLALH